MLALLENGLLIFHNLSEHFNPVWIKSIYYYLSEGLLVPSLAQCPEAKSHPMFIPASPQEVGGEECLLLLQSARLCPPKQFLTKLLDCHCSLMNIVAFNSSKELYL